MQGLIATSKPFESKFDNIFAFSNEVSASFYLYIMMLLSDSNGVTTSTQRESLGWALAILMCAVCLINLIKAFLILLKKMCTYIKAKII